MTAVSHGQNNLFYRQRTLTEYSAFACWSALRTGKSHFPESTEVLKDSHSVYGANFRDFGMSWNTMQVYDKGCNDFANTTKDITALKQSYVYELNVTNMLIYRERD